MKGKGTVMSKTKKEERLLQRLRGRLGRDFDQYLELAQISPDELVRATLDPVLMAKITRLVKDPGLILRESAPRTSSLYGENGLLHGVYRDQAEMLRLFRERCAKMGIPDSRFKEIKEEISPNFDRTNPEHVLVLDATLSSERATMNFLEYWLFKVYPDMRINYETDHRVKGLAFFKRTSTEPFRPWTLRWRALSLEANLGLGGTNVVHPTGEAPGFALLFFACLHPERFMAIKRPIQSLRIDGLRDPKAPDVCPVLMGPFRLDQCSMVLSLQQPDRAFSKERSTPIFL